eukprot:3211450-Lingulodinium_polyedra.AAC.1
MRRDATRRLTGRNATRCDTTWRNAGRRDNVPFRYATLFVQRNATQRNERLATRNTQRATRH